MTDHRDGEGEERVDLPEHHDWRPSEKEKLNEQGQVILRVAGELRDWISTAPKDDREAQALRRDLDTLEEVGRWLSGVTPICASEGIRA